jgi:beta-aspartyl-peptidase (threonine type)
MRKKKLSIVVHGGAWDIPDNVYRGGIRGCRLSAMAGYNVIKNGASALDAVEIAVRYLEDDPTFNAGIGSFLNSSASVELDAAIMDGRDLSAGAVAAVSNVTNPVSLARKVMEKTEHILLAGQGAEEFAIEIGMPIVEPWQLLVGEELERWQEIQKMAEFHPRQIFDNQQNRQMDTVGAVAIDKEGNLAAATSTGGVPNKLAGRVGDSPLIGCGTYADNKITAVSCTGWGESIIRIVMAKHFCGLTELGNSLEEAGALALKKLSRLKTKGLGGLIAVNPIGDVYHGYNTPRMLWTSVVDGKENYPQFE